MGNKICLIFLMIFACSAVLAIARPQRPGDSCGANEEFTFCGTACPSKCSDNPLLVKPCSAACVVGCQCRIEYLLNDAGQCVRRSEC